MTLFLSSRNTGQGRARIKDLFIAWFPQVKSFQLLRIIVPPLN